MPFGYFDKMSFLFKDLPENLNLQTARFLLSSSVQFSFSGGRSVQLHHLRTSGPVPCVNCLLSHVGVCSCSSCAWEGQCDS
ncbi:hypothetical protein MLD38_038019 [Melastoma candidum]|uniref:Uncharacterized protein n=1 Tax=Melastoma candidum TaxID=119954 RepID=A0ACB9KXP5_9MYRT|nr:hypothetical protein MLD38_038019 [Melastoma candidum]